MLPPPNSPAGPRFIPLAARPAAVSAAGITRKRRETAL
jgi:hypothetical protein